MNPIRTGGRILERPIIFTPEDGGKEKPLSIRAFRNEQVTLSGGKVLHPVWKPYKKGILTAVLQDDIRYPDMLLSNGNIRHMARYPNFDSTAVRFNGTSADATAPRRVKSWKHPEGGYLHAMHISDWGDFHYRITGKDKAGKLMLEGGWQNNRQSGLHAKNRMVENIFEELDAPGEWFYQAESSTLYYYPMPDEDAKTAVFETPILKHLIEFRGSEQQPVTHITIQGIELTQTLRTFMDKYEPLLRSDWMVYRGGAVVFEGTEDCSLKDCYIHNLGGNAVFFSCYNRRSTVSGSHFTRIGASAVCFVGDPNAVRSPSFEYNEFVAAGKLDRIPGPIGNNYPAHCLVYDNLIHSIGLFEKQITGASFFTSSMRVLPVALSIIEEYTCGITFSTPAFRTISMISRKLSRSIPPVGSMMKWFLAQASATAFIAMPSKILEEVLFLRKPASKPMKLPIIHASSVVVRDKPRVYGRLRPIIEVTGSG